MEDLRNWESQFKTMTTKAGKTYDMPTQRRFKLLRSQLGIVNKNVSDQEQVSKFRNAKLAILKAYYDGKAYDHLKDWFKSRDTKEKSKLRSLKPPIQYNLSKTLSSRVTSKIIGKNQFAELNLGDHPDDQEFLSVFLNTTNIQYRMTEAIRLACGIGSSLFRWEIINGGLKTEVYNPAFCYPTFDDNNDLAQVRIQYTYFDKNDRDENNQPKEKWFRLDLTPMADIAYDNPEYDPEEMPEFEEVRRNEHGIGFVQAEWFKTCHRSDSIDGYSLVEDVLGFIDDLNYSLSQTADNIEYNQNPQLAFTGPDSQQLQGLVKGVDKAWKLGEATGMFIESSMTGFDSADRFRVKMLQDVGQITGVILLEPEKMASYAQSGKALTVLCQPFVDLVEELIPSFEKSIKNVIAKMINQTIMLHMAGQPSIMTMPQGYFPQTTEVSFKWPPVFAETNQDLQARVGVAQSASQANLISRVTATRYIADIFNIDDPEEEAFNVDNQEQLGGGWF